MNNRTFKAFSLSIKKRGLKKSAETFSPSVFVLFLLYLFIVYVNDHIQRKAGGVEKKNRWFWGEIKMTDTTL